MVVFRSEERELVHIERQPGGARAVVKLGRNVCTVHARLVDGGYMYAVSCYRKPVPRPGEPPYTVRGRRYFHTGIPHNDFKTCDAGLWVERYRLHEELARMLREVCEKLTKEMPPLVR